jgi:hypothetical protein
MFDLSEGLGVAFMRKESLNLKVHGIVEFFTPAKAMLLEDWSEW